MTNTRPPEVALPAPNSETLMLNSLAEMNKELTSMLTASYQERQNLFESFKKANACLEAALHENAQLKGRIRELETVPKVQLQSDLLPAPSKPVAKTAPKEKEEATSPNRPAQESPAKTSSWIEDRRKFQNQASPRNDKFELPQAQTPAQTGEAPGTEAEAKTETVASSRHNPANSIRPRRNGDCIFCQQQHMWSKCPRPTSASLFKRSSPHGPWRFKDNDKSEICTNFNYSECHYGACNRLHRCVGCGSDKHGVNSQKCNPAILEKIRNESAEDHTTQDEPTSS